MFMLISNEIVKWPVLKHLPVSLKAKRPIKTVLWDCAEHIHQSLICSTVVWGFLSTNENIMLVDFANRMKCGHITENKTLFDLPIFKFVLHCDTELLALFLCHLCLRDERAAAYRMSFAIVSLLHAICRTKKLGLFRWSS